jgi:ferredoxin-NADP reductase/ferredoxin
MTTHNITLTTCDGETFAFVCEDSESLVDGASRANILLPSMCRQGSCGVCGVTCVSGDYKMDDYNHVVVTDEEAAQGAILACRTYPRGDLQLEAPYKSSDVNTRGFEERTARIVEMETVANNVVRLALRLEPDGASGEAVDFEPGQFMQLAIPGSETWRAYSPANTANWEGRLEFFIRLRPGGMFSEYLMSQARAGAILRTRGPQGVFYLHRNGPRARWFVTGGSGLAPVLSMLRRMAENQELQEARLFFGVNQEDELFALDELERLKKQLRSLKVEVRVWRASESWRGLTGTPLDGLAGALKELAAKPNGSTPDLYLCGPAPLIESAQTLAHSAGVPAEQIFAERFVAGSI